MLVNSNGFTQTPFSQYDPLSVGFLSQGQMGYFPQQQFLTPADYGAFRTLPQATHQILPYHRTSEFINTLYAMSQGGRVFGLPLPLYTPTVNPLYQQVMARRHLRDIGTALYGASADALLTGILAAAGPVGWGISLVLPSFGSFVTDVQKNMRGIQTLTSTKIMSGPDLSGMGMGFASHKALSLEQFLRQSSASDAIFKLDDYREILRKGIESNLFDFQNTIDGYKKAVKRIRDQIEILKEISDNKDLDSIFTNLKRLQTMGASDDIRSSVIRLEGMFSRMAGIRHSDMVNTYGQQGALIYSQYGLTNYQGSLASMANAALVAMSQRMGLVTPGELARHGGASGLAQSLTESGARAMGLQRNILLPYLATGDFSDIDMNALRKITSGALGLQDAAVLGASKVRDPEALTRFLTNADNLMQKLIDKLGPIGTQLLQVTTALSYGTQMGIKDKQQAIAAGLKTAWGYSDEQARILAQNFSNNEFLRGLQEQQQRELYSMAQKGQYARAYEQWMAPFIWLRELGQKIVSPYYSWRYGAEERNNLEEKYNAGIFGGNYATATRSPGYISSISARGINVSNWDSRNITFLSSKHESFARGSSAIGYDSAGGTSYGKYQISSRNMDDFLEYVKASGNTDIYQQLSQYRGQWNTGSRTGAPVSAWQSVVSANPEKMSELEYGYIKQRMYDPVLENIKNTNPALHRRIMSNPALQNVIFSMSVQHSGAGVQKIIQNAYREGMSDEELINAIYDSRSDYVRGLSGLSAREKKAVLERYGNERADALALASRGTGLVSNYQLDSEVQAQYSAIMKDVGGLDGSKPSMALQVYRASKQSDEATTSALAKLKVRKGALSAVVADVMGKEDYDDISDEHLQVVLRKLGKSEQEIDVLLSDEEVRRAILKEYGRQNTKQLALASDAANRESIKEMEKRYKSIDEYFVDTKKELANAVGRDNADRLLALRTKNNSVLSLARLQQLMDEANRNPNDPLKQQEVYRLAAALGISDREVAAALESGSISALKSTRLSKEELSDVARIGREGVESGINLRNIEHKLDAVALAEARFAGSKLLESHGLKLEDVDEDSEIDELMKKEKDARLLKFLSIMRSASAKDRKREDFIAAAMATAMGSEARMAEGGAPLASEAEAAKIQAENINIISDLLKSNNEVLSKNTQELEKLNQQLALQSKSKGFSLFGD